MLFPLSKKRSPAIKPLVKDSSVCQVALIATIFEESKTADGDACIQEVEPSPIYDEQWDVFVNDWVPEKVAAPEGFTWFGKVSFIIFGLGTEDKKCFSPSLRYGIINDSVAGIE